MLKHTSKISLRIRTKVVAALAALATVTAVGLGGQTASAQFDADDFIRLNRSNPIIFRNMFPSNRRSSQGDNIDGPSMIRVPNFVQNRANSNARYYLYFGHHDGDYIRMAWSRDPDRGFNLYRAGASVGTRGVLDNNNTNITNVGRGIQLRRNHLASPDAHVDITNNRITLFFHHGGPYRFNGRDTNSQRTFVVESRDGLSFRRGDIRPFQLGPSYFKVFERNNRYFAVHNDGGPNVAPNNLFSVPGNYYNGNTLPTLWPRRSAGNMLNISGSRRVRHSGVLTQGNNLRHFYSVRGDSPERIYFTNVSISSSNANNWRGNYPGREVLRAVGGWEEGQRSPSPSVGGAQTNVNQLRDPDIFQDNDGSLYMYYSGAGEEGIGVCAMSSNRQRISTRSASHDAETRQGGDRNRNFRSSGTITVAGGNGTSDRRGYFRFNTPNGPTVRAAVLRLYLQNNESGSLDVYGTNNFNESSITGNNQPSRSGGRIDRVPIGFRGFYELDITPWVNSNRSRNIRVYVEPTGSAGVQISSSENGNRGRRPQLKFMQRQ